MMLQDHFLRMRDSLLVSIKISMEEIRRIDTVY